MESWTVCTCSKLATLSSLRFANGSTIASVAIAWVWSLADIKEWFSLALGATDVQLWGCTVKEFSGGQVNSLTVKSILWPESVAQ
jgi:hypothetical protein